MVSHEKDTVFCVSWSDIYIFKGKQICKWVMPPTTYLHLPSCKNVPTNLKNKKKKYVELECEHINLKMPRICLFKLLLLRFVHRPIHNPVGTCCWHGQSDPRSQNSETGQQIFELLRNIYIWSWLGVWVGVEQVWDLEVLQGHPSYPEQVRTLGTSQSLELNRPNGGENGSLRWLDHSRWVFPDAHNIKLVVAVDG